MSVARYLTLEIPDDHICCCEANGKQNKTFLISLRDMRKIELRGNEVVRRWDFLKTLEPPAHLSIENGKFYEVQTLAPGTPDYDFVAQRFTSTFNGR